MLVLCSLRVATAQSIVSAGAVLHVTSLSSVPTAFQHF